MKRILLVEDDLDVRPSLEIILRGNGYEVDAATTVAEANALLGANSYDLVIADERLPDGRGVKIADKAAATGIARVVITGYLFQAKRADLDRHEHLLKPLRPTELLNVVRRIIGEARTPK